MALPIWTKSFPADFRPQNAIYAARNYIDGKISEKELYAATYGAAVASYRVTYCTDAVPDIQEHMLKAASLAAKAAYDLMWVVNVDQHVPQMVYGIFCNLCAGCKLVDASLEEKLGSVYLRYVKYSSSGSKGRGDPPAMPGIFTKSFGR